MKLFSLIVMFSLICTGCGEDSTAVQQKNVETNKEQGSETNTNEQSGEVTLTHKADNDEDVRISYKNPQNGKKVTDFEMQPGQCVIFKKEQFQFVKDIKLGVGGEFTGITYDVVCSSNKVHGKLPCQFILDNGSYEVVDVTRWRFWDDYILKQSEQNTSPACQYFEDIL